MDSVSQEAFVFESEIQPAYLGRVELSLANFINVMYNTEYNQRI